MHTKVQSTGTDKTLAMNVPLYSFMCTITLFIIYFGFIAAATLLQMPLLTPWFELRTPIVDLLRQYVPSFDDTERAFTSRQMGSRIVVVHHLMAVGWLILVVALLLFIALILSMPRAFWMRALASRTPSECAVLAMLGIVSLSACVAWAVLRMAARSGILYTGTTLRFLDQRFARFWGLIYRHVQY